MSDGYRLPGYPPSRSLMARTCGAVSLHVIGTTFQLRRAGCPVHPSWPRGASPLFFCKLPAKLVCATGGNLNSARSELALAEGPSCIFVGPVETASKEVLEALYRQARDAYYSGKPLIVDDMFDKVELRLRCYGSKSVIKYPRCSLRRQSTYADAEVDPSQVLALAGVWLFFLAFGTLIFVAPSLYAISLVHQDVVNSRALPSNARAALDFLSVLNGIFFMGLSCVIGYSIASASVRSLKGLWRSDLVALKGPCPNCGEEVFAFVHADQSNKSPHRADCHVCECSLEFRTKVEQMVMRPGRRWVYGRIYLVPGTARRRWKAR